ncbi:MAG: YajG family lipoprotein [Moritella sp.]|uniref:YajG family lipoprotein n=1 Tax=Moritella sp. TaxID=78556 RepID=UPI0029BBAA14|nr:YajG family lipoprotein [Moritella sp.]MDX2320584.1 YajG family lipoprotein [Moritella sp.]
MLKKLLLSASLLLLTACASAPQQVNITAEPAQLTTQYSDTQVSLTSKDIRDANYLIAIHKVGEPAQLLNNEGSLVNLTTAKLQQGWEQQGLVFKPQADIAINLELQTARIDVQQDSFEHQADSALVLIISIENKGQTLTKQYRSASTLTGAFSPSMSDLEAKFSQQLSSLLDDIFNDQQIRDYLAR